MISVPVPRWLRINSSTLYHCTCISRDYWALLDKTAKSKHDFGKTREMFRAVVHELFITDDISR